MVNGGSYIEVNANYGCLFKNNYLSDTVMCLGHGTHGLVGYDTHGLVGCKEKTAMKTMNNFSISTIVYVNARTI